MLGLLARCKHVVPQTLARTKGFVLWFCRTNRVNIVRCILFMSETSFDPYHVWLGIPPEDQPANHYRLLGLQLFESDLEEIGSASLSQIAHVRTFAIGANSEQSQLLLNELSAARLVLLNAVQKADYDQDLRQRLNLMPPPVEPVPEARQEPVTASIPSMQDHQEK